MKFKFSHHFYTKLRFVILLSWGIVKPFSVSAQDAGNIDSLHRELQRTAADTNRVLLLCELAGQLAEIDSSKAFTYAEEAFKLSKNINYAYGLGYSLHTKGIIHDYNYSFSAALDYYLQSLNQKEKIGDLGGIAAGYTNIGVIYYFQDNLDKALEYYRKALDKRSEMKDSSGMSSVYNNMAIVFRKQGKYEEALELYNKALSLKESMNDRKGIANTYSNLSTFYQVQQNYKKALEYEQKSLEIEKELQNLRGIAHSLVSIGIIELKINRREHAYKNIKNAITYADSSSAVDILFRAYQHLSEMDSLNGNPAKALANLKKSIYYKDILHKQEEKKRIEILQTVYETEKKDNALEIASKEKDLLLKENVLQLQRIRFWVILSLLALSIIVILFYLQKEKQKNFRILEMKNKEIAASLKEKEVLLREIHHRVKNNLQIVSGLLSWQSQQSNNEEMKKTVIEGKNRLKSMAMLHERLYGNKMGNLKSISVKDYVSELTEELYNAYGLKKDDINILNEIEDIELDVDMMVPLGLIITELISNAIKHAFPEGKGEITVSLKKNGDNLLFKVKDNGIGIEAESKPKNTKSFGLRLVEMMAQKLEATLKIEKKEGTEVCINIKHAETVS